MKTITKKCTTCKELKSIDSFHRQSTNIDNRNTQCISCSMAVKNKTKKTKRGLISSIYSTQKTNSTKRGHIPPNYLFDDLYCWLNDDWLFNLLFDNWTNTGHQTLMRPSIDRLDINKPYAMDNIQIMTWGENKAKGYLFSTTNKYKGSSKNVSQLTRGGIFVQLFKGVREAGRVTGISHQSISKCCLGYRPTAGNYIWVHS